MNNEVKRTVMAIGAHADDIEINVGATLLKYRDLGYEIVYVMATNNMSGGNSVLNDDGSITTTHESPSDMMKRRQRECADAAKVLSTTPIHLNHPQGGYFTGNDNERVVLNYGSAVPQGIDVEIPSILTASKDAPSIENLANLILEKDPEVLFTHCAPDPNIEHSAVCTLVTKAFWKAAEQGYEGGLLYWNSGYSMYGDSSMRWDTFVDGTNYLDTKMQLIGMHRCQMPTTHKPDHGHRLLTEWRGKVCGCEAAEVFNWARKPIRCSKKIAGDLSPIWGELTTELVRNTR